MTRIDETALSYTDSTHQSLEIRGATVNTGDGEGAAKRGRILSFETPEQLRAFSDPTSRRITVRVNKAFVGGTNITVATQTRKASGSFADHQVLVSGMVTAKLTKGAVVFDGPLEVPPDDHTQLRVQVRRSGTFTAGSLDIDCPTFQAGYGTGDKAKATAEGAELRTAGAYGTTIGSR